MQAPARHHLLSAREALELEPEVRSIGLLGGALYTDSRSDDGWHRLARSTDTTADRLREWCAVYGTELPELASRVPADHDADPGLAWHLAMTRCAVACETAQRLEDVYRRRTGLMVFSRDNGRRWLEPLASQIADLLN